MRTFAQHLRLTEASAEKSMQFMEPFVKRALDDYHASHLINGDNDAELQSFLVDKGVWNKFIDGDAAYDDSLWPYIFEYLFNYIQKYVDPTNGKYTVWIVRLWAQGKIERWEDMEGRTNEALSAFHSAKSSGFFKRKENAEIARFADINQFASLTALEAFIVQLGLKDQSVKETSFKKHLEAGNFGLIYGDENEFVIILDSEVGLEASVDLFRGPTAWCTARPGNDHFGDYGMKGPLYAMKTRSGRYAQFHFPTNQFLDEHDSRLTETRFNELAPLIFKLIKHIKEFAQGEYGYEALVSEMVLTYWSEEHNEPYSFKIIQDAAQSLAQNLSLEMIRMAALEGDGPLYNFFDNYSSPAVIQRMTLSFKNLPAPFLIWMYESATPFATLFAKSHYKLSNGVFVQIYDHYVTTNRLMPPKGENPYSEKDRDLAVIWARRKSLAGLQDS